MESILISVKKMLGIDSEYTQFDADLIMHINAVFATLTQMGVGSSEGFTIFDEHAVWTDFMEDEQQLSWVKSYMGLKVKLLFDPPTSSVLMESTKKMIDELEFRLSFAAEQSNYN